MVILTNEGLEIGIVKTCMTCKELRWRSEYAYGVAKRCLSCQKRLARAKCKNCGDLVELTTRRRPKKFCAKPECQKARWLYCGGISGKKRSARCRARKTQTCSACGVAKPRTTEFFTPIVRDRDTGEVSRFHPWCRKCFNATRREQQKTDEAHRLQRAAERRARYERQRQMFAEDREAYEAFRERRREIERAYAARRRAKRRNSEHAESRPAPTSGHGPNIPARPLMAVIASWQERERLDDLTAAERLGVSDRRMREWRKDGAWTRLEIADKCLIALDLLWWEVWDPEEYPEVARIWEGS